MSRLLLIEENMFIRDALMRILQKRFPYLMINECQCCEDCLTGADEFKPDILIFGIKEGDIGKFQNLHRLREMYPSTVIILFIDYEFEEYRKEAVLHGANHIISKELWTGKDILALLKTILATKRVRGQDECREKADR